MKDNELAIKLRALVPHVSVAVATPLYRSVALVALTGVMCLSNAAHAADAVAIAPENIDKEIVSVIT
jgi:hypothetical protein